MNILQFLIFFSESILPFIDNRILINFGDKIYYKFIDLDLFTDMLLSKKANVFFKIIRHNIDIYFYFYKFILKKDLYYFLSTLKIS
jgi:hypothetical protein